MPFLENGALMNPEDTAYELFAIVVHRGGAHGGHYYANIRDCLNEGDWDQHMKIYLENRLKEKARQEEKEKEKQLIKEIQMKMELESKDGESQSDMKHLIESEAENKESKQTQVLFFPFIFTQQNITI